MNGPFVLVLLSVAVFALYSGWVARGMRATLQDHVLAQEAERLAAKCAELATTRADLAAECVQLEEQRAELAGAPYSIACTECGYLRPLGKDGPLKAVGIMATLELPPSSQGGNS